MHSRIKLFVPLGLLFCFGCIDVPPVDVPPEVTPPADGGTRPNSPEQADFTLSASPPRASVLQGKSQTLQLWLTRKGGFSGSVSVSAVNPPVGVMVQPVTIPAGSTSVNLDVAVSESAEPGAKGLTLKATAGTLSHEATVELTVERLADLLVSWASPSEEQLLVKGPLALQVSVEGGTADYVELLKGQTVLARLGAAPYQYTWDTTAEADGEFSLTARAVRGTKTFLAAAAKTVTVDNTAPTLVMRSPGPGASNVSVHEAIRVSFSEALNPSTAKKSSVWVTAGGTSVEVGFSWSADGKTLTLTPTAPWPVASTLTATLGTPVEPLTDAVGNALSVPNSWTFVVPAWLPMGGPISAQPGNTPAENVAMTQGADGNPVIAWSEFDGFVKNIHVSRWNGSSWEAMGGAQNSVAGYTDANNPSLALDGDNQVNVVWNEGENSEKINLYGRRWTGSGWVLLPGMPPSTTAHPYSGLSYPSAVRDETGRLAVASTYYVRDVGNGIYAFGLNSTRDGWNHTSPRASDVLQCGGIVLTADASRKVIAAYRGLVDKATGLDWGIIVQRLDAEGGWTRFGESISTASGLSRVAVAVDGAGNPLVAWENPDSAGGTDSRVYATMWLGGSWKNLGDIAGTLSTSNVKPAVLMGNDGSPLIAWSGFASPERNVWVSRWAGNAWQLVGAPLSARSGASTAALNPVLALDKNGHPLVAWHEFDGSPSNISDIYVYRYNY